MKNSQARRKGAAEMTVVYIDALFLLNFVVNYLLLLSAGKLAGEVLRRLWLALGAAVGALYAAAVFFPGMGFLLHPLCKISMAVVMVLIAYGGSRRLLRVGWCFLRYPAAFGGGIFALGTAGGTGAYPEKRSVLFRFGPAADSAFRGGMLCGHHPGAAENGVPQCAPEGGLCPQSLRWRGERRL